jgi:hypothetical protein
MTQLDRSTIQLELCKGESSKTLFHHFQKPSVQVVLGNKVFVRATKYEQGTVEVLNSI